MLVQDFYDQLQVSDVGKQYLALVKSCKGRALVPEPHYEIHHIHPTKLGGSNTNDNKVKLSVFEHCQAHALLAQAIPCYKTLCPIILMSKGQVRKLSDLEQVSLEKLYGWAELHDKATHRRRSIEEREKNRLTHLGKKLTPEHIIKRTARRTNTVTVTDGTVTRYVLPSELDQYLTLGWKRGISEKRRKRLSESHKGKSGKFSATLGRKVMHLGDREFKVKPEDVETRLAEGYVLGRAEGFSKQHAAAIQGKTNAGKIRINRDGVGKVVPEHMLQSYLEQGWHRGLAKHS